MRPYFFLIFCTLLVLFSCKSKQPTITKPPKAEPTIIEKIITDTIEIVRIDTVVVEKIRTVYKQTQPPNAHQYNPNTPINISEFRAAWVASVANITWPSEPGLPVSQQKQEALEQLNFLQDHNFNAVILQVRPQADALYPSTIEPWSYFLTGKQGQAPQPFYDPLQFWISEAHKRGLELHAWLNPYRAHHLSGKEISSQSIIKTNPEMVVQLANGMFWLDPALQSTQDYSLSVVKDIVRRYDVDGIHFDDYFYPYHSYNNGKDFPDDASWQAYKSKGGNLSRSDWRRKNVNHFVRKVYQTIKSIKAHVKFGISPFGIWRPGYPQSITGFDAYERLYADAKLWLNKGWVDYLSPQLYWAISNNGQSFPQLLAWWQSQNTKNRHVWPGIKAALQKDLKAEIENQIQITRGMDLKHSGVIFWSLGTLMENKQLSEKIKTEIYQQKALVPASPWLCQTTIPSPKITISKTGDFYTINWQGEATIEKIVVYYLHKGTQWQYQIVSKNESAKIKANLNGKQLVNMGVTAVNRAGCESEFIIINF